MRKCRRPLRRREFQVAADASLGSRSGTSMRAKPRRFRPSHCDGRLARLSSAVLALSVCGLDVEVVI